MSNEGGNSLVRLVGGAVALITVLVGLRSWIAPIEQQIERQSEAVNMLSSELHDHIEADRERWGIASGIASRNDQRFKELEFLDQKILEIKEELKRDDIAETANENRRASIEQKFAEVEAKFQSLKELHANDIVHLKEREDGTRQLVEQLVGKKQQ